MWDALTLADILQLLAFVWGAAKLHSAVGALEKTTDKLGATLNTISDKVHGHAEEIVAIKVKVGLDA